MNWLETGFQVFGAEPAVSDWATAARGPAEAAAADRALQEAWLRHRGTWFVGVDALPNDRQGRVGNGPPFAGTAYDAAIAATGVCNLHPAQVSVTFPGYPSQDPGESETAHLFRLRRDAAHLDGLLPEGAKKRRHLREPHAWIIGVALSDADPEAAPLVVWEGSHNIMRRAMKDAYKGIDPQAWGDLDVTDTYKAARAEVFETCKRIEVPLAMGESVLVHRLAIHGVAPWVEGAKSAPEGRVIAYFRPCFAEPSDWLERP